MKLRASLLSYHFPTVRRRQQLYWSSGLRMKLFNYLMLSLPTARDIRDPKYCPYHRRKGHSFSNIILSRNSLVRSGISINSLPFLKHDDRSKVHVMMSLSLWEETEGIKDKVPEVEPDLDWMAWKSRICLSPKTSMTRCTFKATKTKAIIELTNLSGGSGLTQKCYLDKKVRGLCSTQVNRSHLDIIINLPMSHLLSILS